MLIDSAAEHALADLVLAVAVDLGHGDLRQPVAVEERQQVVAELPRVVGDRARAQLRPPGLEPLRRRTRGTSVRRYARESAAHRRASPRSATSRSLPAPRRPCLLRYEAAANVLFQEFEASVLCPYDASRLASHELEAVVHTHPQILGAGPNPRYVDPRSFVRAHAHGAAPPPKSARHRIDGAEDVASARALVRAAADGLGLAQQSIDDLSLAVSEVVTNALCHGEEPRCLSVYVCDGHLVCQITDAGAGLPDPLAGYLPPAGALAATGSGSPTSSATSSRSQATPAARA